MVRAELDAWYELWDRAGAAGLDTWREFVGPKRAGTRGDPAVNPGTEGGDGPVGAGFDALGSDWEGG